MGIEDFDPERMDINMYLDAFGSYCEACNIKEKMQVVILIVSISHNIYTKLRDLLAPKRVRDHTLQDAKQNLIQHFVSKSNITVEGYKFNSLRQAELQSFQESIIRLRRQAMRCLEKF